MKGSVEKHLFIFLLFGFLWCCPASAQTSIDLVAGFLESQADRAAPTHSFSKREIRASLNPQAIDLLSTGRPVASLRVSLFPNTVVDLQGVETNFHLDTTVVNEFSILGDKGGSAILSVTDGVLYGTITTGTNIVYRIRSVPDGLYLVEELDQSKFPECATQPGSGTPPFFDQPTDDPTIIPTNNKVTGEDDGSVITLLVAYTQAAETAAGGAPSMASLIAAAESETNTGLSVSGVTFTVDVVHTTKVTYTEPAEFGEALTALTNTNDGEMDSIHGLRDTYDADLVVLLVDIPGSCGLGWLPGSVSPFNSHLGFTVTNQACATGNYTFAHEIGHNMSLRHDMYVDNQLTPYSYGHGFVNTTAQIRSIMAYNTKCGDSGFFCSRVNHWSATDTLYNGTTVLGDEFATNNVALNNSAYAIANYRPILLIPDLQPIQPSGWDSSIVISNVTGTTTSAGVIFDDQPIYVDYNCANLGSGDAGQFRYGLYIDDVLETFIERTSLNAGFYSFKSDYVMGALPAGTYTFKVVCDYNGDISEFNENNNEFSRSFTITSREDQVLDLQPIQPNGWDSSIVISNVTGTTTTAGVIFDDEPVYVDFNCYNAGPADASQFRYGIYIDDVLIAYAEPASLEAGSYSWVGDYSVGALPAGTYTFKVVCDYNGDISEFNENNNEFSRSFTITSREDQVLDLQPIQPNGWDSSIVISNVTGTTTTAGVIFDDEPVYIDFNCYNAGPADAGQFRYGIYIDDVLIAYAEPASLEAGFYSWVGDYSAGTLPAGTHTFKVGCDYQNVIVETDENNNEFSRNFTILARSAACNVNTVTGVTEFSTATHEACETLVLGPDFEAATGSDVTAASGLEINFLPGFLVQQGATLSANVCGQSLCEASDSPMPLGCHSCVDQICAIDPFCCSDQFDGQCQNMVGSECKLVCAADGPDTDGDRLADSVETNTGIFNSLNDTGTDPNNPDTDGDGIWDGDEVLGTLAGLDLPVMGASPLRKDLLLEYDWFDDGIDCGAHTHQPSAASITSVTDAFANSTVINPDGSTGVNLINDYGQGGAFTGGNLIADEDGVIAGGVGGSDFLNYKAANFASNRNGYFHYVLLPHRYNTSSSSSGQAEVFGDDLIVSLYCANSDSNVANTIMHEVGHNLNLLHGGDESCNYKPNYNSVMNYKYQFPGVDSNCTPPGDGVLNFSIGDRIQLNENNLNEFNGTCGSGFPYDWDGNGTIESSVSFNINEYDSEVGQCGATLTTIDDYDDWSNILFGGVGDGDGAPLVPLEIITEQPVPAEYLGAVD